MRRSRWQVYRLLNHTRREMYLGVSKDPPRRIALGHCVGETKALTRWNCDRDVIAADRIAGYDCQRTASAVAHLLEDVHPAPAGWKRIRTAGI